MAYSIKETLEKPLKSVNAGVDAMLVKMLLQFRHKLFKNSVVMHLKTDQLREARNKET
jgi:hypothetical protein